MWNVNVDVTCQWCLSVGWLHCVNSKCRLCSVWPRKKKLVPKELRSSEAFPFSLLSTADKNTCHSNSNRSENGTKYSISLPSQCVSPLPHHSRRTAARRISSGTIWVRIVVWVYKHKYINESKHYNSTTGTIVRQYNNTRRHNITILAQTIRKKLFLLFSFVFRSSLIQVLNAHTNRDLNWNAQISYHFSCSFLFCRICSANIFLTVRVLCCSRIVWNVIRVFHRTSPQIHQNRHRARSQRYYIYYIFNMKLTYRYFFLYSNEKQQQWLQRNKENENRGKAAEVWIIYPAKS